MNMKPKFAQMLLCSRFMLPVWLGLGTALWSSGQVQYQWRHLDDNDRLLAGFFLLVLVIGLVKTFPKVWAYEQAKLNEFAAWLGTEEMKRRGVAALMLLAVAGCGGSLWWLSENSYAVHPDIYVAAVGIVAGGSLWAARRLYSRLPVSLLSRLRGAVSRKEKAFIVRWALPIPKRSPNRRQIEAGLPDYCKLLLAAPMRARIQKAVEAQFLNAANS